MIPGGGTDMMPAGRLMWNRDFALCLINDSILILFGDFDGKVQVLLCSVVNFDIMREKLLASLEFIFESID